MRFLLFLLLLSPCCFFRAPTAAAQPRPVPSDWATYRDSATGYTLSHPRTWEARFIEGARFFISPMEDKRDVFRENVNIVIQDMADKPMMLEEYAALSRDQVNRMGGVSKVLSERRLTLAGQPAMEMVSDFTYEGSATKVKQMFFVKGRSVYLLTFTALPETYDQHAETGTRIMETFGLGK